MAVQPIRYTPYSQNVKLGPNQQLHYQAGKGYYAGPKGTVASRGLAPGGNYGYNTGGPLRVTTTRPRTGPNNAASKGWAPGGGYGYDTGGPLVLKQGKWVASGGTPAGGGGGRPKPPAPPPPPVDPYGALTFGQINTRAGQIAQSQLDPQEAEIRRQQALAAQQAAAEEAAIQGFSTAAAGIEGQMVQPTVNAYGQATQEIGQLGQGLSAGIRGDLQAQQAQDQAQANLQGQTLGPETTNAQALGDVTYGLSGLIPGETMAGRGAVAGAEAAAQPGIQMNVGREQLNEAMAAARDKNDQFAQQLISVAQQYPGMKAQALQQLQQYELDKANYRQAVITNNRNWIETNRRFKLAQQAENATIAAAKGLTPYQAASLKIQTGKANQDFTFKMAGLQFKNKQEANKAKLLGKTIDVPASRALGHVVYKDGTQDPSIHVAQYGSSTAPHTKALAARGKAVMAANKAAYSTAYKLIGTPIKAKTQAGQLPPIGRYVARKGAINVFKDGTTNDKQKAAKSGGVDKYSDAFQHIWGAINADQLMAQYNLSRRQVTNWIHAQMKRAGWRIPGSIKAPHSAPKGAPAGPTGPVGG